MRTDLLVSGFGPFLSVHENPAAMLAAGCGLPHAVLEVSFEAVDAWIARLAADPPRRLLLIGVAGGAERMRLERAGHNRIVGVPDVRGVVRGPGFIEPHGRRLLGATIWDGLVPMECDLWCPSDDAGGYLCNYALYRALQKLKRTRVGFLHVPPLEVWNIDRQRLALDRLLEALPVQASGPVVSDSRIA